MTDNRSTEETTALLVDFIRNHFLDGDPEGRFDESSPLLDTGVLTSLNTAVLLNYIHKDLGATLALDQITRGTFQDVRSISAALTATDSPTTAQGRGGS
ncbi:acyl carrier protein [Nocardiopsis sp. ATB16-24]|uniref:acyl carrier protein n=1 Tax=Nocardiopsis sp. ATB16-24 TaxID=3019555 RepID=UPI00255681D4|nr:acyl carrier protein [Nocardiopsis sp. ATB16-24]